MLCDSLCWVVPDLGNYHHARLEGLRGRSRFEIHVLEAVDRSSFAEFGCPKHNAVRPVYQRHTLHPGKKYAELGHARLAHCIHEKLHRLCPDVVCVNGWADTTALAAMTWAIRAGSRVVLMSESTAYDERRRWWREAIKRRIVALGGAALAGGAPQCAYLHALGFRDDAVFTGYDAVDNAYFSERAAGVRSMAEAERARLDLPSAFFLASSRFVAKKNLFRLLDAYAAYRRRAGAAAWHLVLLGDGELRAEVERRIAQAGLADAVILPGFIQYEALPRYYGLAEAFVHASTSEQWGLVVNEAMASGLPVLVSERCGCVPDLVQVGVNGFTFDPCHAEQLAGLMQRVAAMTDEQRRAMGRAGQRTIADWGPERFADGLLKAVDLALSRPPPDASWFDQALLWALIRR